jgi:hypothetical protein
MEAGHLRPARGTDRHITARPTSSAKHVRSSGVGREPGTTLALCPQPLARALAVPHAASGASAQPASEAQWEPLPPRPWAARRRCVVHDLHNRHVPYRQVRALCDCVTREAAPWKASQQGDLGLPGEQAPLERLCLTWQQLYARAGVAVAEGHGCGDDRRRARGCSP